MRCSIRDAGTVQIFRIGGRERLIAHMIHTGFAKYDPVVSPAVLRLFLLQHLSAKLLRAIVGSARSHLAGKYPER